MGLLVLVLAVLGLVLFLLAAFGVGAPRVHLGWLGAAFLTLAYLLAGGGPGW